MHEDPLQQQDVDCRARLRGKLRYRFENGCSCSIVTIDDREKSLSRAVLCVAIKALRHIRFRYAQHLKAVR